REGQWQARSHRPAAPAEAVEDRLTGQGDPRMDRALRKPCYRLALFATLLAAVVVLLGAYTRLTHAGLGCPDWPGCYGFLGVPMSEHKQALAEARFPEAPLEVEKGWNEMVHRYFAGTLGLVILLLAIRSLRRRGQPGQPLKQPLLL